MSTRSLRNIVFVVFSAVLGFVRPAESAEPESSARPALSIFDGSPKVIVVIPNSHRGGGKDFQHKIERWFAEKGGKSPLVFRSAGGWQTPVDPKSGEIERGSWLERFTLEKEKALGHPVIVIALCGVTMPRADKGQEVPINEETVRLGVDRCRQFAKVLKSKGADEVFLSPYHYFEASSAPQHRSQYDPDYTLKVYEEYRRSGGLPIDCLSPTRRHHPLALADDQFHPSATSHAVYAQCWFEAFLKHDGLEVPGWSRDEMDAALKAAARKADPKP